MSLAVRRLTPEDAAAVVACFKRVYGDSYANELFYQSELLAAALREQRLRSIGAFDPVSGIVGHMAMTLPAASRIPELGNTIVDPRARGQGVAWRVGAALTDWCRELGYAGFLHYPTTDHHIMQRQSVKKGFETGLMLGYIPAETDGKVHRPGAKRRQAATIVYEPLAESAAAEAFLPSELAPLIRELAGNAAIARRWQVPAADCEQAFSSAVMDEFSRRGLARLRVRQVGADLQSLVQDLIGTEAPCLQLDLDMADRGIERGLRIAQRAGFFFCGWLPDFAEGDVLRLQKVDEPRTEMLPALENPVARSLLETMSRC